MAQRVTNSVVNTNRPGSYFKKNIKTTPIGVSSNGTIVIFGEADGGAASYSIDSTNGDILKDNYFTLNDTAKVQNKYISGNIVEAFEAIVNAPGPFSASRIYIAKTNKGTQANATIASSYGVLTDKNWGINGNKYFYQITQTKSEISPFIKSSDITFDAVKEEGNITISQSSMADGDYIIIIAQDGTKYAIAVDTTGSGSNIPGTGTNYANADYKSSLDVSAIASDADLATAIIGAFNLLTNFTSKVTLVDNTSAVIGINQITTGLISTLPTGYNKDDTSTGIAVGLIAVDYTSTQTGDDADGSLLNGLEFQIRLLGGSTNTITLSATESDHDTVTKLAAEIDGQLPSGISCVVDGSAIKLAMDDLSDNQANVLGYGRNFELIDSQVGDLAAIGLSEGLNYSSQEPEVELTINRTDTNLNESFLASADVALHIGYEGDTAEITITDTKLTTTVTGGSGSNLDINFTEFPTLKDLADFIDSQTGYSCAVEPTSTSRNPDVLDNVTALNIASSIEDNKPGRIKRSAYNFFIKANESADLEFDNTATLGLPLTMAKAQYLTGGEKGSTSSANIISIINELESIDVNFIVPLFSRDSSEDISEALTDSNSSYSINAINIAIKDHCNKMSKVKVKKNRQAILSMWDTYLNIKDFVGSLASERCAMAIQKSDGYLPWRSACVVAGMQVSYFYESIINKISNITSFEDPEGFDSGNPGQVDDAIDAGLLIVEKSIAGNKWIVEQTTYIKDSNFVYNSIQAMYTSDLVCLDLSQSVYNAFGGKSNADVDASSIISFISSKIDQYKGQKLITTSDVYPLGYDNLSVTLNGAIAEITIDIVLSTAILFFTHEVNINKKTSSAEA